MKLGAVIMAAGISRRMGKNKLLLKYGRTTFIENIVGKVIGMGFHKVVITVSDKRIKEICEEFLNKMENEGKLSTERDGLSVILNRESGKGMSESVKLGVKMLEKDCEGYMFFSGDQPALSCETIEKIMKNSEKEKIVIPLYNGKKGLPTVFDASFKDELSKITGDTGGRQVILNNIDKVKYVEIENFLEGMDIDTEEEYKKLLNHRKLNNI